MKKQLTLLMPVMLSAGLLFYSCKGKEGPIGPEGPQGAAGTTGTTGAKGDTGPSGTANIVYSPWIELTGHADWSNVGNYQWVREVNAPEMTTAAIGGKSIILIYLITGGGAITPLPHIQSGFTADVVSGASTGTIRLARVFPNALTPILPATYSDANVLMYFSKIRYVIVPGSTNGRIAALDYNNYEQVKKYYNLPD